VTTLAAVDEFARRHDADDLPHGERVYRDLVPLTLPSPGQQYGFEVDLDACTGCKACVTACHSLNGLDDDESWRSVGFLHGGKPEAPVQQTVTTACHHCVEPACLQGCPVDAYEKDPLTGIVNHLDDQCIGCGYCTLTCPYEVPQFNQARGIVRKCDMCKGRLEAGEAPACVQACPNGAIRIAIVDTAALVATAEAGGSLVAGAPSSAITVPSTVYRTSRAAAVDMQAADHFSLRPAHAHPPLAVMLVLTQLAVGAVAVEQVSGAARVAGPLNAVVVAAMGLLALGASVFHLGRPALGYRAVIGFRHSWLSREIVAFGAFAGLSIATAAARLTGVGAASGLAVATTVAGVAGVACSAMIYAVTGRVWWRLPMTATKFTLTALWCGGATVVATTAAVGALDRPLALVVAAAGVAKLAVELSTLRHLRAGTATATDLHRTARLLTGELAGQQRWRFALGLVGVVLPVVLARDGGMAPPVVFAIAAVALAAVVAGELIERSHFFRAAASPRMPGGLP
jgi:Fe-S-cluster-containing dehydrogenase component/DMSO reductase anchor subunit